MRKKRVVKEGSPFEEEYLLELMKEETCLQSTDKEQVKGLMRILMYFSMIEQANILHSLVEKVMIAQFETDQLMSVEQEQLLQEQTQIKEVFEENIGWSNKKQSEHKKLLGEWENHKCYKH